MAGRTARVSASVTKIDTTKGAATRTRRQAKPAPTPSMAQASEVEKHVADMAIEHIQCRDFGHSWRPFSAQINGKLNIIVEQLRCARCTTLRVRHLGMRGQLLDSKYDYVEGYTVKGMGRLTGSDRDVIRLASVRHLLQADTVQE